MTRLNWLVTVGTAATVASMIAVASASAQQRMNVRGTIEKVDGSVVTLKSREGPTLTLKLSDKTTVRGVVKAQMSDIKIGSYLAVSAMPQPDGSQRALTVVIFPQGIHPPEAFRPHDLQPGSTMTNATVEASVSGVDGPVLTVNYKAGEKKIIVPANAAVVTYAPGDKAELKPGAKIVSYNAVKQADGSLQVSNVNIGRDGTLPPM
jgi:hypothetical protein